MDRTITFLGGDARMRLLAQMMAAEGADVRSWALPGAPGESALCDALKAEIIVLPLPMEKEGRLSGTDMAADDLLRALRPRHRIFAGSVSRETMEKARALGLHVTDYFTCEELSVRHSLMSGSPQSRFSLRHTTRQSPSCSSSSGTS